jgi:hypothetical protein
MGGMSSWFRRRRETPLAVAAPSAWRYGAPTSDTSSGSTTVVVGGGRTLTAAGAPVPATERKVKRGREAHDDWQAEAWSMYDQVGELRYVSNAIAGRCGQAVLYVEKDGERVDDSEDEDPVLALVTPQMVERLALNIFVAGGGYLCGVPVSKDAEDSGEGEPTSISPEGAAAEKTVWFVASALEVKRQQAKITIRGEEYDRDKIYLERIWDPHPANWFDSDSPVRSALPVLRELVGLTQHVSAQIDSRLAGAGVYWIPNEILQSVKAPTSAEAQTTFSDNPVLNAIMTGMLLPIEDRSNASAVVPTLMGAPGDWIDKIRHDSFSTPFDENTKELREEAIRRLGLNLDAPPELLQGMGDANHWGMWLVRDEVVTTHVSPRLDLIADALTTGFYRPVKQQQGDPDPESYVLKFDTSGLVQRPNRLADASGLHAVNAISDKALREAGNFDETDAPSSKDRAIALALQVASANPQLLDNMPEIVETVMALLDGTPASGKDAVQSQREPGTLKPLAPGNRPQAAPPTATAPNGTPTSGAAPLPEADAAPGGGAGPNLAARRSLTETLALMREQGRGNVKVLVDELVEAVKQ